MDGFWVYNLIYLKKSVFKRCLVLFFMDASFHLQSKSFKYSHYIVVECFKINGYLFLNCFSN